MNAIQKLKLTREAKEIVTKVNGKEYDTIGKLRAIGRLKQIIIALDGQVREPEKIDLENLSDNTNDENYRWKDTAIIGGARKFMYQTFSEAKKEGRNISVNEIDWNDLKKDTRLAETMIVKKNVFGVVDWNKLRNDGMPSNVAYLINRVFRAVDKAPLVPTNILSCQNFVKGVTTLRERLEACRSYDDVKDVLTEINKYLSHPKYLIDYYADMTKTPRYEVLSSVEGQIYTELGKRMYSWFRNSANEALHECRTNRNRKSFTDSKGANWDWLDGEKLKEYDGKSKPKRKRYTLQFAEVIERVGGKPIDLHSSKQLEQMFNFRGVQSGNWVLKDRESAEFHMKSTAEAMLDMGDVLGIDAGLLGLKGNLAVAFGARGKGGALAHYERSSKVINITKVKGGGSLGHEYFHAFDNLVNDLATGTVGTVDFFGTENHDKIADKELGKAFKELNEALFVKKGSMKFTSKDVPLNGKYEDHERLIGLYGRNSASLFNGVNVSSLEEMDALPLNEISLRLYSHYLKEQKYNTYNMLPSLENMIGRYLVHRHFKVGDVDVNGNEITFTFAPSKSPTELFLSSIALDLGKGGAYWSSGREMSARAFSAYLEDKLAEQGRKNTYLAFGTNSGSIDQNVFPQGEERKIVNRAFDKVFKLVREKNIFGKASENQALLDSLFDQKALQDYIFKDFDDGQNNTVEDDDYNPFALDADETNDLDEANDLDDSQEITIDINSGIYDSLGEQDIDNAYDILFGHFKRSNWQDEKNQKGNICFKNQLEASVFELIKHSTSYTVNLYISQRSIACINFSNSSIQDAIDFVNEYVLFEDNKLDIRVGYADRFYNGLPVIDDDKFVFVQPEEQNVNDLVAEASATSTTSDTNIPQDTLIANQYAQATISVGGLQISIENPIGSVRSGTDENGTEWKTEMKAHYGYFIGTKGADGDEIDVFVASGTPVDYERSVFVISQINSNGDFDEHKCIIGVPSRATAIALYRDHYDENAGGIGAIREYQLDVFKEILKRYSSGQSATSFFLE